MLSHKLSCLSKKPKAYGFLFLMAACHVGSVEKEHEEVWPRFSFMLLSLGGMVSVQ